LSDTYFDSTPSEIQTPEERAGLNPPDDIQMRRTNPKRYDKLHDNYDANNDAGHDSGIENRFEDTIALIGWDIKQTVAENFEDFTQLAKPMQIWKDKDKTYLVTCKNFNPNGIKIEIGGDLLTIRDSYFTVNREINFVDTFPNTPTHLHKNDFPLELVEEKSLLSWDIETLPIICNTLEENRKGKLASIEELDWQIDSLVKVGRDELGQLNNLIIKRAKLSWDIPDIKKIQELAQKAKDKGYEYVASVVKSYYNTTYYNVNDIDDVIAHGWQAAPFNTSPWRGRMGQSKLPDKTIMKYELYRLDTDNSLENESLSWNIPEPEPELGIIVDNIDEFIAIAKPNQVWKSINSSKILKYLHLGKDFRVGPMMGDYTSLANSVWGVTKGNAYLDFDYIGGCALWKDRFPLRLVAVNELKKSWDLLTNKIQEGDLVRVISNVGNAGVSYCVGLVGTVDLIIAPNSAYIRGEHGLDSVSEFLDVDKDYFKDKTVYVVGNNGLFTEDDLELVESKKAFDLKENRVNYESIPQDIRFKFREQHLGLFNNHPEVLQGMNNVEFIFTTRPYGVDSNVPGFVHPEDLEVDLYGTPELLEKNPDAVVAMLNVILQHVMKMQGFEKSAALDPEIEDLFANSEKDYVRQHEDRLDKMGPSSGVVWSSPEVQKFRFTQLLKLGDLKDKKVLDVGAGFGSFLDFLNEHKQTPERYVGIDLSEKMLNEARKQHPEEFFELRNIRTEPFDSNVFDYGIACGIFANDSDSWDSHVIEVLKSILNSCKVGVGVNFLHEHMKYIGGGLHYDNPQRVLNLLKQSLNANIELLDHPEENDFTLLIRK